MHSEVLNRKQRELLENLEDVLHHNMVGNDECDGLKSLRYEKISSQAACKQVEGSTTRVWSLSPHTDMVVKPQECAARKGRYSLICWATSRASINSWPLTQMNSVPFSYKVDTLSVKPFKPIVTKALRNDASKALDIACEAQFTLTALRASPTSGTSTTAITLATTGTQTSTSTVAFQKGHAKSMVDAMKERNIPAYQHGDYYAITWPSTIRTFKNDLESIKQYTTEGFNMIKIGEVGRYENTRYIEQTNIAKAATTYTDWIYFLGEDTVAEAICVPEEIRGKIPSDYGRSQGVAWYYLGGFAICHTSSMDTDQSRIIKWESAA